jgi:hypothetical protein
VRIHQEQRVDLRLTLDGTVQITEVRYRPNSNDPFPLVPDTVVLPSFETVMGHRYLAIGYVSATSTNGPELDVYNTVSLSVGVQARCATGSALLEPGTTRATPVDKSRPRRNIARQILGSLA